jgi:hypothetical protein
MESFFGRVSMRNEKVGFISRAVLDWITNGTTTVRKVGWVASFAGLADLTKCNNYN